MLLKYGFVCLFVRALLPGIAISAISERWTCMKGVIQCQWTSNDEEVDEMGKEGQSGLRVLIATVKGE